MRREPWWIPGLHIDDAGSYCYDGELTGEQFHTASCDLGRNEGPRLLYDMWTAGNLNISRYPAVVTGTWSMYDWPTRVLDEDTWVEMFDEAGYTHDGEPAEPPAKPVTVYRGCSTDARFGMSWTTDVELARRFASGTMYAYPIPGQVYVFTAPPVSLLAFIHESGRRESEYVIEPHWLLHGEVTTLD